MKKLSSLIEGDVTLKYQLISEELDALVTVKSDEDLRHMFDEYDRQELNGTPRLRTFLFPAKPIIIDNQIGPMDRHSLEQRYINSINGIIFNSTPIYNNNNSNNSFKPQAVNTSQTSFTISSACSSPRTPPETTILSAAPDFVNLNPDVNGSRKIGAMTRARSSPNLCDLSASSQPNHSNHAAPISTLNLGLNNQQYPYHHQYRQPPPPPPPHHYHHSQFFPKPPIDPSPHKYSVSADHPMRMRSSGLAEYCNRHSMDHNQHQPNPYARSTRSAHMVYQRGSPYDEYYANNRYDRESPPGSPLGPSPHQSSYISKLDSVGGR